MSKEFKMTDPGEGLQEAEILEVHVAAGDTVEDGDIVLTVETDKASTDIPAPFTGQVEEVCVGEGDMIEVGGVLMTYDDSEQDSGDEDSTDEADDEAQAGSDDDNSGGGDKEDAAEDDDDGDQGDQDDQQPAHEKNVEAGDIDDDSEADDAAADESEADGGKTDDATADEQEDEAAAQSDDDEPVPAAPSTRRLAREKNVNLHDIEPSGKQGRVTDEDVKAAANDGGKGSKDSKDSQQQGQAGKSAAAGGNVLVPGGGAAPELPDFSQWGEIERVPLRSIKRATARNMARSWGQIPHVYHQDSADVTALDRFRREHEEAAQAEGGKFTLTVLVMKALASALAQFPRFNASLDADSQEVIIKHYCHIGLAVATDRGLLVPVIRNVDQKNLVELTAESTAIARKARDGDIGRADMQGGGITLTNPGPMGGSSLTPLINHPQVAILGMAQARLQPTIQGDLDAYTIVPRLLLPLVLGFDHRVNDGAEAAQFVTHLKQSLADPESLLLDI